MSITYSVPTYIILSGIGGIEYGNPVLACALNTRIYAKVQKSRTAIQDPIINRIVPKLTTYLRKEKISWKDEQLKLTFKIDKPFEVSKTYSAPFITAAIASLLTFFSNKEFDRNIVNRLAYKKEGLSDNGLETSVSTHGGLVYYRKEFTFLKTISLLQCKIPKKIEKKLFLLPISNINRKDIYEIYKDSIIEAETWLRKLEKVTKRMVVNIIKEDDEMFRQVLVEQWFLIKQVVELPPRIISLLKKLIVYGTMSIVNSSIDSKGKTYILFFADNPESFMSYCRKHKITYIQFIQSTVGLRRE